MRRFCVLVVLALASICGRVNATEACFSQLDKLVADWNAIAVPGSSAAAPNDSLATDHGHSASEVWYMRSQLRLALRLCQEGNDHEAHLRMDVVRAWLKLPEVQHPVDHRYRLDAVPRPPN